MLSCVSFRSRSRFSNEATSNSPELPPPLLLLLRLVDVVVVVVVVFVDILPLLLLLLLLTSLSSTTQHTNAFDHTLRSAWETCSPLAGVAIGMMSLKILPIFPLFVTLAVFYHVYTVCWLPEREIDNYLSQGCCTRGYLCYITERGYALNISPKIHCL